MMIESEPMDRKVINFRVMELKDDGGEASFTGLGSVFGNVDTGGDIVKKGAFKASLKERWPKLLLHHGHGETGMTPVGKYDHVKETADGLEVAGKLFLETDAVRLAYRAMKEQQMDGLSIGYVPKVWEWDDKQGVRILKEVELHEVSLVTFPMNESARIQTVKARIAAGEVISKSDLEAILRDAGLSRRVSKAIVAEGHAGISQRDVDDQAIINAIEAQRKLLQWT